MQRVAHMHAGTLSLRSVFKAGSCRPVCPPAAALAAIRPRHVFPNASPLQRRTFSHFCGFTESEQ